MAPCIAAARHCDLSTIRRWWRMSLPRWRRATRPDPAAIPGLSSSDLVSVMAPPWRSSSWCNAVVVRSEAAERTVEQRTFALKLAYDGTAYGGSQLQANAKTVQEELESALEPLAGRPTRVALAGRTDSGVHA